MKKIMAIIGKLCTHRLLLLLAVLGLVFYAVHSASTKTITISSLAELDRYAGQSGNHIRMAPGLYRMTDYIPLDRVAEVLPAREFHYLHFSGSDNSFDLRGVTIEFDTELRTKVQDPRAGAEFRVSGNNNTLAGLSIINLGDGFPRRGGGQVLHVDGDGNTLRDCTLVVRGSAPYGYGDLLGKGDSNLANLRKRSGLRITGSHNRFIGCKIFMQAFGHAFFIQEGADNTYFEDCYAEGELRSTDEMLAETSGPAYEINFASVYRNREGEKKIPPGYMQSLAETGFRVYTGTGISLVNCTAKNMRAGFAFSEGAEKMVNCTAIGNEVGFRVGGNVVISNSSGDAKYGPLIYLADGNNSSVELELLPDESDMHVHALATINGSGHNVSISAAKGKERTKPLPIMLGFARPSGAKGTAPFGEARASGVTLRNTTSMPVIISEKAVDSAIFSTGDVIRNDGKNISVHR
jgi:hypothetical protein